MALTLDAIHIFPLKSGAPLSPPSGQVGALGLDGDRRWMLVDDRGRFVTARQVPRLVLIRAQPTAAGVRLEAPGSAPLDVAYPTADATRMLVSIWDDRIEAPIVAAATPWLEALLGRRLRLAFLDAAVRRAVSLEYGQAGDTVSFADGFPLLLIAQASLDGLNARLSTPLPMLRFRPNLVVGGAAPHAEDQWRRIRVGAIELDVVKPCARCVLTTVDANDGAFDPSGEPLRTLKTYRRTPKGITFGQNLIPRGSGSISLGDPVQVLA